MERKEHNNGVARIERAGLRSPADKINLQGFGQTADPYVPGDSVKRVDQNIREELVYPVGPKNTEDRGEGHK